MGVMGASPLLDARVIRRPKSPSSLFDLRFLHLRLVGRLRLLQTGRRIRQRLVALLILFGLLLRGSAFFFATSASCAARSFCELRRPRAGPLPPSLAPPGAVRRRAWLAPRCLPLLLPAPSARPSSGASAAATRAAFGGIAAGTGASTGAGARLALALNRAGSPARANRSPSADACGIGSLGARSGRRRGRRIPRRSDVGRRRRQRLLRRVEVRLDERGQALRHARRIRDGRSSA